MNYPPSQGQWAQQPPKKGLSAAAIVLLILAVLCVLGFGACAACILVGAKGVSDAAKEHETKKARVKADDAAARSSASTVAIGDLLGAYKANEVSADARFKGNYVRATGGKVLEIRKTIGDQAELWVNRSGEILDHPIVHCTLTPEGATRAAALKKGSRVTMVGKVTGMIGSSAIGGVFLDNCELAN